jgi:hypothetical protein
LRAGVATAAFLVALFFGRYVLSTTFHSFDDEGYLLLSLDHYLAGGHLYTQVYSQYGPFYFFAEEAFFRLLWLPVNHDAGRLVTLICCLLSAIWSGYFIYKVSANTVLASAAGLASMSLAVVAGEPNHPQQLVLPMLMLACCASLTRRRIDLLLLGALGTGLFFIKINIGVFYFAAVAHLLACGFSAGRVRTICSVCLLFYAVGCPLILMRQDLPGWTWGYCLLAILCGVAAFLPGLLMMPSSPKPMHNVLYVVAGAVVLAALVVIETTRQSMSLKTLLEGVLWGPLRHPGVFQIPLQISKIKLFIAVLISACIAGLYWFRDRWRAHADLVDVLRCLTGLCVIALVTAHRSPSFAVVLLPLGIIPTSDRLGQSSDRFPYLFVTTLAATQFLSAYPVAGTSQQSITGSTLLLWAFLCVHDGATGLFRLVRRATDWFGDNPVPLRSVLGGIIALALAISMLRSSAWPERYPASPSSLRGASFLRLPAERENLYESLAGSIKANCDVLFSLPGMGSFNYWSGVPTPNGLNLTAWMKGFSLGQQEQILDILQTNSRACAIYNGDLARFWGMTQEDLVALPLARYIIYTMPKVWQKDGYEIRVHPGRKSPWLRWTK